MGISVDDEAAFAEKFAVMRGLLTERQWRVYLGTEANALGYGGVAAVARAAGVSPVTVKAGAAEAGDPESLAVLDPGRSRRVSQGRPRIEDAQPGLRQALEETLEAGRRGDPVREICWNSQSLQDISDRLGERGFTAGKDALARLMREAGYSLQGMSRVKEGRQYPGRDAQFTLINDMIGLFMLGGLPVISCDTKKKEKIGEYYREGRTWQPAGQPAKVRDHDFADEDTVQIAPYGIYDIARNTGFVSVGTSHDTGEFAVNALRLWWQHEGSLRYPGAEMLLVTVDAGGSNGHRSRLWRREIARLAEETGLTVIVLHFPPSTSKWNKVEHRLFCHITRTWRQSPLLTLDDAVAGIATTTSKGLKVTAVRDDGDYRTGIEVSDEEITDIEARWIDRGPEHDPLSYAVLPSPRPAPEPAPAPERPGRVPREVLAHPALTGIPAGDHDAITAAMDLQLRARLDMKYQVARKRDRIQKKTPSKGRLLETGDYLTICALRSHLELPDAAIGSLLGISPATVASARTYATQALTSARLALPGTPQPENIPRTPDELLAYAAAAGIPLAIPDNGHPMPEQFEIRKRGEHRRHTRNG